MSKVAVTYNPIVGGSSVISLKESFQEVSSKVVDADYRQMMSDISEEEFKKLYATQKGRQQLFAHAKAKAIEVLNNVDCLGLSGNSAMIDPELFNQKRQEDQCYDFSRTIAELALVHVATEKGMPILGVCGGHQVVAIYSGGETSDLNSDQLNQQRIMNYDTIKIYKDTILAQIISGQDLNKDATQTHHEHEFFGAHTQVVSRLGKGFKQTAIASDNQSIEATENEFGVPILTTQFHPEIGAKGLPHSQFIYQKTNHEIENGLKIFDYFNKTGDAYHQKKLVMEELNSFTPKNNNQLIKLSDIRTNQKPQKNKTVPISKKNKYTYFNWKTLLATLAISATLIAALFIAFPPAGITATVGIVGTATIGAATGALAVIVSTGFGVLAGALKKGFGTFLRNRLSEYFTNSSVTALKKKEVAARENIKIDNSSYSVVLNEIAPSPKEILRDIPQKLWTKKQDDHVLVNHISNEISVVSNKEQSELWDNPSHQNKLGI